MKFVPLSVIFAGFFFLIITTLQPNYQGQKFAVVKKDWNSDLSKSGFEISNRAFDFIAPGLKYGFQAPAGGEKRPWVRITFSFALAQDNPLAVPNVTIRSNEQILEISFESIKTSRGQIHQFIKNLQDDSHLNLLDEVELYKSSDDKQAFRTFRFELRRPYEWRFGFLYSGPDERRTEQLLAHVDFREKSAPSENKSSPPPSLPPATKEISGKNAGTLVEILESAPNNAQAIEAALAYFRASKPSLPEKFDKIISGVRILNERRECSGYQFMLRLLTEVLIPQRSKLTDKEAAKIVKKIEDFSRELSHDEVFFFELCKRYLGKQTARATAKASAWKGLPSRLPIDFNAERYRTAPDSLRFRSFFKYHKILVEHPGEWMKNRSPNLSVQQLGAFYQSLPSKQLRIALRSKFKNDDIGSNFVRRTYPNLLLEVTGSYTSENQCMVGLGFEAGEQVGFLPREWEGLLIMDADGNPLITAVTDLREGDLTGKPGNGEPMAIFAKPEDFVKFIGLAKKHKLSILQSHILVNKGKYDDNLNRSVNAKRRVLAKLGDGAFAVINLDGTELSLHQAARILVEIDVQEAINLDSGLYDICRVYHKSNVLFDDLSHPQVREGLISNKLILYY